MKVLVYNDKAHTKLISVGRYLYTQPVKIKKQVFEKIFYSHTNGTIGATKKRFCQIVEDSYEDRNVPAAYLDKRMAAGL